MNGLIFVALIVLFATVQSCEHNGRTYRNGEEWTERNSFVMRCIISGNGWRTEVIACLSPSGLRIPIDGTRPEGNYQWECKKGENGNIVLSQGLSPNADCDGHRVGTRWVDKSFELECRPGGIKRLRACVTEEGQRISVNSSKEINGFTLICQQFANGTVLFHGAKSVRAPKDFNLQTHSSRCIDEQSRERRIGDYWVENHRFNKTCKPNGAVEVVNCITKDGVKVPLNGQVIRDNTKYSCEMTPQGTIRYAAGPISG